MPKHPVRKIIGDQVWQQQEPAVQAAKHSTAGAPVEWSEREFLFTCASGAGKHAASGSVCGKTCKPSLSSKPAVCSWIRPRCARISTRPVTAALALPGLAGTHKLPEEKPLATITIPDAWTTEDIEDGIEATSDDGEVYIAIETTDADNVKEAMTESVKFLKEKGVTVDDSTLRPKKASLAIWTWSIFPGMPKTKTAQRK